MDPKEIARVLSRHDCIGEKSAETIARGDGGKTWVEPAGIAIALLALESRLAEVHRALDEAGCVGSPGELVARIGRLVSEANETQEKLAVVEGERDENRRWADHWNHRMSVHLRRVGEMEKAATYAAAELRHAYRDRPIDPNLVARAIETLEALALPGAEGREGDDNE